MKTVFRLLPVVLAVAVALPVRADDREKAQKELNKITALASDAVGRTVINLSMADYFKAKRPDLVLERRDTGLNYGQLFVMHTLMIQGVSKDEIASQVKSGQDIFSIANAHRLNWKQVGDNAKKLNAQIDQDLYHRFLDKKAGTEKDQADGYLLTLDGVIADNSVTPGDMNEAGERFRRQRDRADDQNRRANKLDDAAANSARRDNLRSSGPGGNQPPTGLEPNH